ncbi:MAG: hypothetical protein ACFFD7_13840 [Candidatus Thorarchaeota archaeon]
MSIKPEYGKIEDLDEESDIEISELFPDISQLIIPFSDAFKKNGLPDEYDGDNKIPFSEKDKEFREILIYEFLKD